MIEQKTDWELVRSFQKGDKNAFDELQKRHQNKIFSLTKRYVKDVEEAIDLCQEVFLRAFLRLNTFNGNAKFYTWLYKVAVNLCIDFHRKRERIPVTNLPEDFPISHQLEKCDEKLDTLSILEREELYEKVREAIKKLPPGQRNALILRYYDELAIKEIALEVGCSEGTVKAQLFHARQKLAKMLKKYVDGEEMVLSPEVSSKFCKSSTS